MVTEYNEKGKFFTNIITKIPVKVLIQTTHHLIEGEVHIRVDERLKDELSHSESFLAVTNAVVFSANGEVLYRAKFLTLNASQIVWLIPNNDMITE